MYDRVLMALYLCFEDANAAGFCSVVLVVMLVAVVLSLLVLIEEVVFILIFPWV